MFMGQQSALYSDYMGIIVPMGNCTTEIIAPGNYVVKGNDGKYYNYHPEEFKKEFETWQQ